MQIQINPDLSFWVHGPPETITRDGLTIRVYETAETVKRDGQTTRGAAARGTYGASTQLHCHGFLLFVSFKPSQAVHVYIH